MSSFIGQSVPLTRRVFLISAAGAVLAGQVVASPLSASRIAFLIGNEGSGGYEAYARAFAKHLALALPGTSISVEMVPTADGRLAAKRIAEAPAGDLTIGLFESALLYSEVEKDDLAPISLAGFNWLGKMAVDERVLIASKKSGLRSIGDLSKRASPAVFPASTVASRSSSECYLLNAMLGLPIKPVPGYNGAQRSLAMLSGEGQVVVGSYSSQINLLSQGDAVLLLRLNTVENPRAPTSAPLLRDFAPKQFADIVELIELTDNLGRWIAAPPSIPADDLSKLRTAFDQVVADKDFLAEAAKLNLAIEPLGGAQVQDKVRALLGRKKELRASFAAALACGRQRADGVGAC